MVEKLMNAFSAEDPEAVAACFADDINVSFVDYCPMLADGNNVHLFGKNAIKMFFTDQFYEMNRYFSVSSVAIEDKRNADFFACYRGKYVYARLTIEEFTEEGFIKKAVIRPV